MYDEFGQECLCGSRRFERVIVERRPSAPPEVADPHHIVVDGKPMTGPEFVAKYCAGKATQKTCDAVRMAVSQDAGHRPVAKGW